MAASFDNTTRLCILQVLLLLVMLGHHVLCNVLLLLVRHQLHRLRWGLLLVVVLLVALSRGCLILSGSIGGVIHRASLIIFYNFIRRA